VRKVFFHGALGQKYGREHSLEIKTPAEAVRAFTYQVKGFRKDFEGMDYRVVRKDQAGEQELPLDGMHFRLGGAPELHFYPTLRGEKDRGTGKILAGIAIAATALITAGAGGGFLGRATGRTVARSGLFSGVTFGAVATLGGALILGGIASKLSPTPQVGNYSERSDERPSFLFNGPVNVSAQGVAVPVVYGTVRTGSVIVSSGITTEQLPP
jgi:predicted phage tail protein